jgi:hypothetical protein
LIAPAFRLRATSNAFGASSSGNRWLIKDLAISGFPANSEAA